MSAPLKKWHEVPIAGIPWLPSTEYKTGTWRSFRPTIDESKCRRCLICWIYCPETAIRVEWDGDKVKRVWVDYDYCKGCGICARECPAKAIEMRPEV